MKYCKNNHNNRQRAFTLAEVFLPYFAGRRQSAFTLAEVLITLGVIGIVAAMTLPAVVNKYQEKATVTKVKKFYNLMSQGYMFALEKYGTPDLWGFGDRDSAETEGDDEYVAVNAVKFRDILLEQVKVLKRCDKSSKSLECGVSRVAKYENGDVVTTVSQSASALLADGSSVRVLVSSGSCNMVRGKGKLLRNDCGWVYIDVNGTKEPNTYGKDIFPFHVTKYGVIPAGTSDDTSSPFSHRWGLGRTAWVVINGNMDYLHCNDLSWSGKIKCD